MVITTGQVGQYKSLHISFMTKEITKQAKIQKKRGNDYAVYRNISGHCPENNQYCPMSIQSLWKSFSKVFLNRITTQSLLVPSKLGQARVETQHELLTKGERKRKRK